MELTKELNKNFNEEINKVSTFDEVVKLLKKYSNYELKVSHLGKAFEKMFVKDEGFSAFIPMEELEKIHHSFHTSNGGDWCRTNQSYLGKKYNIERKKGGNRIIAVKTDRYNKQTQINQSIRSDILNAIRKKKCVILDIGTNIECDHKDGLKNDWRLNDKKFQKLEDFQPLTKTANDAKREHCTKCKETGKRYDARKLGYKEAYIYGSETSKTCVGCYWYNPQMFNQKISENFNKLD